MAEFLDGVPRYPKMHPCGLVLSRQPLHQLTPTFIANKGYATTHFDMDAVEAIGLVKMDILAQGGLAAMRDVKAMLAKRGIEVDLQNCTARRMTKDNLPTLPPGSHLLHEPPGRAGCPQPAGRGAVRTPRPTSWPGFMVPMHSKKRKEALHEPTVRSPGFSRSGPPEGGTPNEWRSHGPIHGPNAYEKRKEAFHEPERPLTSSLSPTHRLTARRGLDRSAD